MKSWAWIGICACAIAAMTACSWLKKPDKSSDEEPLLLLEEGPARDSKLLADNSRCFVCHLNFSDEKLVRQHARKGVGCENCHGQSDAHCGDENNITPPDRMYARDMIKDACMQCHPEEKLARKKEHKMVLAGTGPIVCTDCHGKHRLDHRTRQWDKKTGELIEDDGVRMMEEGAFDQK